MYVCQTMRPSRGIEQNDRARGRCNRGYIGSRATNDSIDATPIAAYRPMLVAEPKISASGCASGRICQTIAPVRRSRP
jgi:hypothetical protein